MLNPIIGWAVQQWFSWLFVGQCSCGHLTKADLILGMYGFCLLLVVFFPTLVLCGVPPFIVQQCNFIVTEQGSCGGIS